MEHIIIYTIKMQTYCEGKSGHEGIQKSCFNLLEPTAFHVTEAACQLKLHSFVPEI